MNEKFKDKDGDEKTILNSLNAAIDWIKNKMNSNPEGFLEYKKLNPKGHENQVWKDSWDSYFHSDGTIANHEQGIASIELQALAYDALIDTAELYKKLNDNQYIEEAEKLRTRAENLKKGVMKLFWAEDERGGYFALGIDHDKQGNSRPMKIRTSNMGHLLNSRILEGNDPKTTKRRNAVIKTLFSPEMLSVSGIRTLSNKEKRFRPNAYHNGGVWLFDNYLIAQGLKQHGYYQLYEELTRRIWTVVDKFRKFPEFARGGDESEPILNNRVVDLWDENNRRENRIEIPPQEIQAWSVAAIVAAKYEYGERKLKHKDAKKYEKPKDKVEKEIISSLKK